jgi:hypothetical protein
MPNWCSNSFTLAGPRDKIKEIYDNVMSEETLLLNALVPINEWSYEEASDSWGTKWDVNTDVFEYSESADGKDGCITGAFDSAWSPPVQAFASYCKNNQDVTGSLEFFEPGMQFTGQWTSETGLDYYEIDPEDLSNIPEDLVEQFSIEEWYESDEEEEE